MILYHGSKKIIERPVLHGSNPSNDYGPSFYLSDDLPSAKEWACRNETVGVVNKYKVETNSFRLLKVLDLTDKSAYSVLNWLAILMRFRTLDPSFRKSNQLVLDWLGKYYVDVDAYDVIVGFRSDDAYFRFPIRFLSNDLAYEDLERAFLLGQLGVQYAFMSDRAIRLLHYEGSIECDREYIGRYYSQIQKATYAFDEMMDAPRDPAKTYVLDLMRKDRE